MVFTTDRGRLVAVINERTCQVQATVAQVSAGVISPVSEVSKMWLIVMP